MHNQITVEIKNFHAGFVKDGVDMYSANVTREDVPRTTDDKLQAILYTPKKSDHGHEYKGVVAVIEVDVVAGDVKKALARLKGIIKKQHGKDIDCRVECKYEYCGYRIS